jgi:hypothetical protein
MARVIKRAAAKRDLTDHFVFLGESASVDVARRFLHACNVSFQALAQMPVLPADSAVNEARVDVVDAPVSKSKRAVACPFPSTFWVNAMLFSPLLACVKLRNWRMEK